MTTVRQPSHKMEKFGIQVDQSKKVLLYRNGDKYHVEGVPCVLHSSKFTTFDQVKIELSKKVGLFTGNVKTIYSMDKKRITDISGFINGHHYICCGAEPLNIEVIPKGVQDLFGKPEIDQNQPHDEKNDDHTTTTTTTTTTGVPPKSPSKPSSTSIPSSPSPSTTTPNLSSPIVSSSSSTTTTKKPVVSAYTNNGGVNSINKFSVQTEKAKVIMCFRNGDKHHHGERVVVHSSKFKTYDQLKEQLSKQVKLPTGSVRKVFSPIDGKLIKTMEDIVDGEYYVCAAGEPLNTEINSSTLLEYIKQYKLNQQTHTQQQQVSDSQQTSTTQSEEMF